MNNYRHFKKMKVFAVRFPLAYLLVAFSIAAFAYLKWDAPASSARTQSSARRAANAPEADDMPILFTRSNDIWKISLNGLTEQRLTQTTEQESSARWSPDRRKIAYQKVVGGVRQIWTMNPDGSNQTLISDPAIKSEQQWFSPNGQKILFVQTEPGGTDQVWTMNPDGSNKTRLTNNGFNDHIPRWSPDGGKIALGRCNADYLSCDVVVMNADGSEQVNITSGNMNDDDSPEWSADGSKIVYFAQDAAIHYQVYAVNPDGSNPLPLTNAAPPQIIQPIQNSPVGNKIVLQVASGPLETFEIATINNDGTNLRSLTINNVYDANSVWSPDGAKIAFFSRRDTANGEIYIMDADGNNVIRLTNNTTGENITDWGDAVLPSRARFDYDGDGKSDISVFRPAGGNWYISNSSNNSLSAVQFGANGDLIAPADYDGDGKTDISVFRPADGTWYRLNSANNTFSALQFGASGDLPAPGDFDGDAKADISVYRPTAGSWYRVNSSNNQFVAAQFGANGDKPSPADFDGDGKADLTVFRPSNGTWYRVNSSNGEFSGVSFGLASDLVAPADYDGDIKEDICVFRPSDGTWYRLNSNGGGLVATQFGANGDVPVPGDYDGDGKADLAVFRPSNGTWYLLRSTAGFTGAQFGANGDVPTPNAFVR